MFFYLINAYVKPFGAKMVMAKKGSLKKTSRIAMTATSLCSMVLSYSGNLLNLR